MEPLHPEVRAALKEAHPGLTDEDIDRAEQLLVQRMQCDPQQEQDRIAQLDRERMELIQRTMPRYAEVARAARARLTRPPGAPEGKVSVTLKKPEQ